MTSKVYKKTFIKETKEAVAKIDDALAFVEYGINDLTALFQKLTKGNAKELFEQSTTTVTDYKDRIERMDKCLSDLYTYKNDILDDLEKISAE